jgi:uncharacterized protein YecE (DUF72 family)
MKPAGRIYVGTSGFAYPAWIPVFYEPGKASRKLLTAYARRLPAVELHNTFYRRPSTQVVDKWLELTPEHFRFCPKTQRGTTWRAWSGDDPAGSIAWLGDSLRAFGDRLGAVLMSVRGSLERDDVALKRVLEVWPQDVPLALELPHTTWQDDEVYRLLHERGVSLVATDWDGRDEPDLRRIGPLIYLRLRRLDYSVGQLERWAQRLEPFISDGMDAYVFLRHDETGESALRAVRLLEMLDPSGSAGRANASPEFGGAVTNPAMLP